MSIGFWEVAFLIILFLGIVIVSRLVERFRMKRICPACGLAIRTRYANLSVMQVQFSYKGITSWKKRN